MEAKRKIRESASAFFVLFKEHIHLLGWLTIGVVHGGGELELWGHQGVVLREGHQGPEESALTTKFGKQ